MHNQDVIHRDLKLENFLFLSKEPDAPLKVNASRKAPKPQLGARQISQHTKRAACGRFCSAQALNGRCLTLKISMRVVEARHVQSSLEHRGQGGLVVA